MISLELMLYGLLLPSLWVLRNIGEVEKTCGLHILHEEHYLARAVIMVLKIYICLVWGSKSWQKSRSTSVEAIGIKYPDPLLYFLQCVCLESCIWISCSCPL